MCGIVGFTGTQNAAPILLDGLKKLEYRGYDSAGIAVLGENGKVDPAKLQPITYDPMNHKYLVLGEAVGQAFHDGTALK